MTQALTIGREVTLRHHPRDMIGPDDLAIVSRAVPPLRAGELLVRNRWFRISISTRLMADPGAQVVEGIPFPPLHPGDTLADGAIGEVVASAPDSAIAVGSLVLHPYGWRDWAVVAASQCTSIPAPDDAAAFEPAVYLGHGWTAYAALTYGTQVRAGDTVFVTSGAGAIGAMAGQIARRLGATRIVGSTGSADKAEWMTAELGYDAVVRRDRGDLAAQLASAAPDGVDLVVDMVGGDQLAVAAAQTRAGARLVLLGALGAELDATRATLAAPVLLDSFQLILRDVTIRGYSACADEAAGGFADWLRWQAGAALHHAVSRVEGLDQAPAALHDACAGRLRGVVIVAL
jgi:NADPH-dependent curcumin reductase CurA